MSHPSLLPFSWCDMGNTVLLKKALREELSPNAQNLMGESLVFRAVQAGRTGCLRELIAVGADINQPTKVQESPLFIAIHRQKMACLKLLLGAGVDLSQCDLNGNGPIHRSLMKNAWGIREVLGAGANPNLRNKDGYAPLHWAALSCTIREMQLLLRFGADVNVQDKNGMTPLRQLVLDYSSWFSKNYESNQIREKIVRLRVLLDAGANVGPETPLDGGDIERLLREYRIKQERDELFAAGGILATRRKMRL